MADNPFQSPASQATQRTRWSWRMWTILTGLVLFAIGFIVTLQIRSAARSDPLGNSEKYVEMGMTYSLPFLLLGILLVFVGGVASLIRTFRRS